MNHRSRAAGSSLSASSPAPEGLTRAPCPKIDGFILNRRQLSANRRTKPNFDMLQPRKVDGQGTFPSVWEAECGLAIQLWNPSNPVVHCPIGQLSSGQAARTSHATSPPDP